jgi:hypothetical protein
MSLSSLMNLKLTLQRATVTPDASGGTTRTFTNLFSNSLPSLIFPGARLSRV